VERKMNRPGLAIFGVAQISEILFKANFVTLYA
jgi:hypothetical protein